MAASAWRSPTPSACSTWSTSALPSRSRLEKERLMGAAYTSETDFPGGQCTVEATIVDENDINFQSEVDGVDAHVVVDVGAPWPSPCLAIESILDDPAGHYDG